MKILILLCLTLSAACWGQIPQYTISYSPAVEESLRTRDLFSDDYLSARFTYRDSVWNDAKIRYKGRSNRFFSKKPIRVRFSKKHMFDGIVDLNLNSMYTDKSFMREKLAWDLFEEMGELAPKAHYATLSINGKPEGLYLVVDKVDKQFLINRGRSVSSVYTAGGYYALADMTLQNEQALELYYPKEVGDKDDYQELYDLLATLNACPDSSFPRIVDSLFDMQSVLNWFSGNILMMMGDSYDKNYFLYRDLSVPLHQWVIIPWDYDISFGLTGDFVIPYPQSLLNEGFGYTFPPLSGPANILKDRFMQSPILRERLRERVDTLLRTVFTNEHLDPRIDSLAALIGHAVEADSQKWGTYQDFLDGAESVKYFITARRNFLLMTYVHPQEGLFDMMMVMKPRVNVPIHCVGVDGRQFATMWFREIHGMDSILVEAHPDSAYPGFDTVKTPRFIRRWLRITPYPENAKFKMKLQWSYHDISSTEREVSPAVKDERALRCFYGDNRRWKPLTARINPMANTATIDEVTNRQCGESNCFMLFIPQE